jgi:hypothetical protein
MAEPATERRLRPAWVFAALGVLLVLAVVTSPDAPSNDEKSVLSSYDREIWGARGIYDALNLMGRTAKRRLSPLRQPLDTAGVYAVLDPPMPLSARETGALLDAVRRGAGLVISAPEAGFAADSFGMERGEYELHPLEPATDTLFGSAELRRQHSGSGRRRLSNVFAGSSDDSAITFHQFLVPPSHEDSDSVRKIPRDTVTLLAVHTDSVDKPVILGRTLGEGRMVVIADPDFLRNVVLRRGDAAVLMVRLIEWADRGRATPVIFDEYHHGHGRHSDMIGTIGDALNDSPYGRGVLQAAAAALILLLALSVRPIAPVSRTIVERRSPLEHVGALSRAYERIGATRLAARRLVRGLRRRHPLGATGALTDDGYLALIRERAPALKEDAALLARAIREPLPAGEFVSAGAAIDNIERTLTS